MRVLTKWATGNPPCAGWWLSEWDDVTPGMFIYWSGKDWRAHKGALFPLMDQHRKWRGLAFNPDTVIMAKLFCDDNVVRVLPVIQEFTL